MSANVNFAVGGGVSGRPAPTNGGAAAPSSTGASMGGPVIILPYDILNTLQGRRVTVMLSKNKEEMEGILRTVDADRGDLFLEDVVHYTWESLVANDGDGQDGETEAELPEDVRPCAVGGGARRIIGQCDAAMVNSKFIDLITPTLFGDG